MNIINYYITGFKQSAALIKMILLIYLVNLILGLLVALPFLHAIKAGFGSSMLPAVLLKGFDFTAVTEFLRQSSARISGAVYEARWIILIYLFLNVFFTGGILKMLTSAEKYSVRSFLDGCLIWLFRYFKLFIYMAVIHIVLIAIVFLPLTLILKGASKTVDSESSLFYTGLAGVILYLLLLIVILMVGYYAKIMIAANQSKKVFAAVFRSFQFVFRSFRSTFTLMFFLILNLVVLIAVYWILNHFIGNSSGITILIMFFIQQFFILSRVYLRIWTFGSQYELYRNLRPPDSEPTISSVLP